MSITESGEDSISNFKHVSLRERRFQRRKDTKLIDDNDF